MTTELKFKFTASRLAALPTPAGGEVTYHDTDTLGLSVRVRQSGAATFSVRYRITGGNGVPQRLTLGPVGGISLAAARLQADEALLAAKQGRDPAAERRAAGAALTVKPKATLEDLIAGHEKDQAANGVVSAAEAAKSLRRELAPLLDRDPDTITRPQLVAILNKVRGGVPGHAKPRPGSVMTLRARIHGLLAWANNAGHLRANVMAGYRSARRGKAARLAAQANTAKAVILDMYEITALWRACEDPRIGQSFGAYVRLLILSGCRRGEMAAARLRWVTSPRDGNPALLTIPASATKSGNAHIVPLPPLALGVIAAVNRFADTDLLTPGARSRRTGKTAPISGWSKSWPRLLKVAAEHGLQRRPVIHDLRKTFRSHLARLGVVDRVAELMLNHTPADRLIETYVKYDFLSEKTEAAVKWADAVAAVLAQVPQPPASVVTLRPAAKPRRRLAKAATVAS